MAKSSDTPLPTRRRRSVTAGLGACACVMSSSNGEKGLGGMNDAHVPIRGLREACHDIRQPIAGVLALAGAALSEAGLPENVRTRLEQIVALAEWQSNVIQQLLEAGEPGLPVGDYTDVVRIVNEAAAVQRVTWPGELTLVWPPEPVFTWLHPVIVRRMVANLLANATSAAGQVGRVTIEVSRRAGWMVLVVEDNGPGFGWLPGGFGLGLSAVARQALEHEGRLECCRGSLGGGRVSLWLPLSEDDAWGGIADAASPM